MSFQAQSWKLRFSLQNIAKSEHFFGAFQQTKKINIILDYCWTIYMTMQANWMSICMSKNVNNGIHSEFLFEINVAILQSVMICSFAKNRIFWSGQDLPKIRDSDYNPNYYLTNCVQAGGCGFNIF